MIFRTSPTIAAVAKFIIGCCLVLTHHFLLANNLTSEAVKKITIANNLTFTSRVEAVKSATASAQTSGRVVNTFFDIGDLVQKNNTLLKLRDTQQKAQYESAVANVKASQALYDSAQKEYLRIKNIYAKKLVSQSVYDKAISKKNATKAALESAKAKKKSAKEQLDYTVVKAPYSGIILKRHIEIGETVNPGTPLYTGMSLELMRVVADVPQKDIDAIRLNQQVTIELPQDKKMHLSGASIKFFAYADPKNSTFKVRINLPSGVQGLYPGMYLKSSFKVSERSALSIATSSLIHRGEVTAVYVIKNKQLSFRQIRIGNTINSSHTEVLSGLSEGELIIDNPNLAIKAIQSQNNGESNE